MEFSLAMTSLQDYSVLHDKPEKQLYETKADYLKGWVPGMSGTCRIPSSDIIF